MLANTLTRYGSVARTLHWTIALLVLLDIVLGVVGKNIPRNAETVDFLKILYSTHKTIGVVVLALAIVRVLWTLSQPRPVALHPDRKLETFAAETAHWVLYVAIFMLPLSGWVMHSAEVGYAPIWWPFGQNLPFIEKSETTAELAASVHWAAGVVLALTLAAHISGALKHAWFDRDGTLARMWRGTAAGDDTKMHDGKAAPVVMAIVVWGATIGAALTVFAPTHEVEAAAPTAAADTGWAVQEGSVNITVLQSGAEVSGGFGAWTASIEYDPESGTGQVTAVIDTTSVTIGSVTGQAKGAEFFDVETYSDATFEGAISRGEGAAHTAVGTLTLVGQTVPVTLNFDLTVDGTQAVMTGGTDLDRRDFGMGASYSDESDVGFTVGVAINLTAQQTE